MPSLTLAAAWALPIDYAIDLIYAANARAARMADRVGTGSSGGRSGSTRNADGTTTHRFGSMTELRQALSVARAVKQGGKKT